MQGEAVKARGRRLSGTAPRLYELAVGMVAERVRQGLLPEGALVTESMLAEQFGISRAPARRALEELARRGMVERAHGRGYRVLRCAEAPERPPTLTPDPTPLLSLPTWERIYGEVENEIVARIAVADWRLNEVRMSQYFHVSRTVARDVVGRLQQRGLLRKDESSRWVAPALSHQRIDELYELREILEPAALVKAAPRLPPGFLAAMRARIAEALPESQEDGAVLDRLEEDMHVTLLGHCGNRALVEAIAQPQSLLVAHRFLYRWTSRMFGDEPFLAEHIEILDRLEAGDARAAGAALERHLKVARARATARVDLVRTALAVENLPYLERIR